MFARFSVQCDLVGIVGVSYVLMACRPLPSAGVPSFCFNTEGIFVQHHNTITDSTLQTLWQVDNNILCHTASMIEKLLVQRKHYLN